MTSYQQKQDEFFSQLNNDPARLIEEQSWKEINLNENEKQLIPEIQKGLKETHHLNGLFYLFDVPYLILRLPAKKFIKEIAKGNHLLAFTPHPYSFGSSIEFMLGFINFRSWSRVYVNKQDIDISKVSNGRFKVLFFYEQKFIKSYSVDISNSKLQMELLGISLDEINNSNEITCKDALAHYWEILSIQSLTKPPAVRGLNIEDQLSIGWFSYFNQFVKSAYKEIQDLRNMGSIPDLSDHKFKPKIREVFNSLFDKKVGIESIISMIRDYVKQSNNSFSIDWFVPKSQAEEIKAMHNALVSIYSCYLYSPEHTNCGQYLPWIDYDRTREMDKIERLKISPKEFNDQELAIDYWPRLSLTIQMNLGLFLKGMDFPVSPGEIKKELSSIVLNSPLNVVDELVKENLSEALANKIWSIPWGAKVDLSRLFLGPFKSVEIYEYKGNIYFIFRTIKGEFFPCILDLFENSWDVPLPVSNEMKRALAIIKLNLSAIIRDFWVVENRDMVFSHRLEKQRNIRKGGNPKKTIIVYLPRIKYTQKPNIEKTKKELKYSERRAHWVSPHIRKCENPSNFQLILSKRYGFEIPKGYTFVKPFEKGKKKYETIFRSRSALQLLYEIKMEASEEPSGKVDWFKFERDVQSLMQSLGYEVEEKSPSQKGDQGVDIFATKKGTLDQENWIVQCKCWKPKNKIHPGVIRDLIGVLYKYPTGTHGMVITTSSFSSGAIKEARDAGIRLIDGNEFTQILQRAK